MSGSRKNDEKDSKDDEEGGWASTFLKMAGAAAATAAVVGGLYSVLNQPQAEAAAYGVRQPDPQVVILKVDGSLLRGKESAGCGGYLSSASKKWICGFVQKLDPTRKEHETEKEAILRGWEAKLSWIPGDQNSVADRLAHMAHGLTSFHLCEIDSPPQNCVLLL